MRIQELLKWGVRYLLWYLFATALSIGAAVIWPEFDGVPSFAFTISIAILTLNGFLKRRDELPSRLEYWQLVGVGTAISLTFDAIKLSSFFYVTADAPAAGTLIFALLLGLLLTLLANMFGFSRLLSTQFLARIRRKKHKAAEKVAFRRS